MKRRTVKALVCATLMAMSLSVTACGGSDEASNGADAATEEEAPAAEEEAPAAEEEASAEEETPAAEEASAEEEAPAADAASGMTLEEYMNSTPDQKKQFEEEMAASAQDGISIAVDVKGNDFTYIYTFEDDSLITDEVKSNLKTGLEATASVFAMMAEQMDEAIGADKGTVTIIVKYQDGSGNVLEEGSFHAE
ncbi:MAG: DUF4854 domain-containing protein [Lachnospiraceae bacterium]|nr:DUF4854 domain-containing protein [Lachnospiraceae bacterium]RKI84736.1 DUF4854 domain-containing protein [bacterium 1xD42-87]